MKEKLLELQAKLKEFNKIEPVDEANKPVNKAIETGEDKANETGDEANEPVDKAIETGEDKANEPGDEANEPVNKANETGEDKVNEPGDEANEPVDKAKLAANNLSLLLKRYTALELSEIFSFSEEEEEKKEKEEESNNLALMKVIFDATN